MGERLLEVRLLPARLGLICVLSTAFVACTDGAPPSDDDTVDDTGPELDDVELTTDEDTAVTVELDATGPDGVALELASTQPQHGEVTLDGRSLTYTPDADFHGVEDLHVTVTAGDRGTRARVRIHVTSINDAPVALDDVRNGAHEDVRQAFLPSVLVDNDTDADGETLTITAVDQAVGGAVTLEDGQVVFTPDAQLHGTASYRYTVSDGTATATATVTIHFDAVNDAPVTAADAGTTDEDTALVLADLLANDTDVDNATLTIDSVGNASHGTVTLAGGEVTFTPAANYHGPAGFTYTATDGDLTDIGFVTVTVAPVNDAPVATNDGFATDEDADLDLAHGLMLGNDVDVDGDSRSIVGVANAQHGSASLMGTSILFQPEANYHGTASFEYDVADGNGGVDTATVTIVVASVNDAPVAVDDAVAGATEDSALVLETSALFGNDTDIDLDPRSVSAVSDGVHGTVSINGTTITFSPDANYNGAASFQYTVSDGNGGTDVGEVTFTIAAVNDAPVAAADSLSAHDEDAVYVIGGASLTGNDGDLDGDDLTVTGATNPTGGTVDVSGNTVTFTPTGNYHGAAGFDYTVSDGNGGTHSARASFTITSVNDAPVATDDARRAYRDMDATIATSALAGNDTDVESASLTVTAVSGATNGTVSLDGATITFVPDADFIGTASFDYTVSDGDGGTDTGHVVLDILPYNLSFEDDYAGWTLTDSYPDSQSGNVWAIASTGDNVTGNASYFDHEENATIFVGCPGPGAITATDGDKVAWNGQHYAADHRMWMDIQLPADAATLDWDMSYSSDYLYWDDTLQSIAVRLRDPSTDAILTTLFATNASSPQAIPMTSFSGDISAFAGELVRLDVDINIHEWCMPIVIDNFQIVSAP